MVKRIILLVPFLILSSLSSSVADGGDSFLNPMEKMHRMALRVDPAEISKKQRMDILFSGIDVVQVRADGSVEIIATPEEYSQLVSDGYKVEVLVSDLYGQLVSRYGRVTDPGSRGGYHSYEEMVQELFDIESDHPGITMLQVIGSSIEERDIYAMKVSDNADLDEVEPEVLFTELHHAREPVSLEICLDLLNTLTDNYGSNMAFR